MTPDTGTDALKIRVGARLRALRRARDLSQRDVASLLNTDAAEVSRHEAGARSPPVPLLPRPAMPPPPLGGASAKKPAKAGGRRRVLGRAGLRYLLCHGGPPGRHSDRSAGPGRHRRRVRMASRPACPLRPSRPGRNSRSLRRTGSPRYRLRFGAGQ